MNLRSLNWKSLEALVCSYQVERASLSLIVLCETAIADLDEPDNVIKRLEIKFNYKSIDELSGLVRKIKLEQRRRAKLVGFNG